MLEKEVKPDPRAPARLEAERRVVRKTAPPVGKGPCQTSTRVTSGSTMKLPVAPAKCR